MTRLAICLISLMTLIAAGCVGQSPSHTISTDFTSTVVPANPRAGFNFPYILRTPSRIDTSVTKYLLVEPNNSGRVSARAEDDISDAAELSQRGVGSAVSRALDLPFLMPVLPRLPTQYTASLDRQSLSSTDPLNGRIDLQVIAMMNDARARLSKAGLPTHDKVFLVGFSASGHFVNRFTALHPTRVQAAVAGAVNGILILPVEKLGNAQLPYPLGVQDMQTLTGSTFQAEAWRRVPQFIFMGADDANDWIQAPDAYTDAQRRTILLEIGIRMLPDRWERCQTLYRSAGAEATFKTYPNVGHWTNGTIHADIARFLAGAKG
jgi:pimeloyl-ACP methyl ester carboxylesterase